MSDKVMSRRKFLASAGTVAAVAAVSGVALGNRPSTAEAAVAGVPWPYPTSASKQPVPEKLGRRGFEVYFASGCAEGTWWPFVEALAVANPETWGTLPKNVFRFGSGGVAGWGTVCGTVNAAAAIIGMTVADGAHRTNLTNAIFQYYANTALPTNAAWKSHEGTLGLPDQWNPASPVPVPLKNVPSSTAHSPLCHSSLVQWTMTTGAKNGGPLQKDRCGKAVFDVASKTAELLNTYFQMVSPSAPSVPLDPSVAACGACHVTYTGAKMACSSCHDKTLDHATD
jgi:hypothetical protein